MTDTPRTEEGEIHFTGPMSAPGEPSGFHGLSGGAARAQLPRADTMSGGQSAQSPRSEQLKIVEPIRPSGPVSRDWEQPLVSDDDRSAIEDFHSPRTDIERASRASRHASRRLPLRTNEYSRDSSPTSDRSSSPPNSVDAFAEPRIRERANTAGSWAGSDIILADPRTTSGGTHGRRPTFGSGSLTTGNELRNDTTRPEEDVCFPTTQEPTKTFSIDFEEIDEFVASCKTDERPTGVCRRQHSFSSHGGSGNAGANFGDATARKPTIDSILVDSDVAEKVDPDRAHETNRFSFFSSELEQTVHAPEIGDLVMPGESFRDLFDLPAEGGAWWLNVINPTEHELDMFQKAFGIHRLTAEDIERQEIREKVELFQKYYFVCFRSFEQTVKDCGASTVGDFEPVNVYMVVFREGILTFTYAPSPHAVEVRKRIGKLRNYINLTADWICYAMIDNIVDSFGPPIRTIELETDQIEDQVFVTRPEDFSQVLRQIGECRKRVMALMRLLGGKADVIKGFAKRCNEQYSVTPRGDIGLYLGDIQDHVITMMSNLAAFEKMLSRSHSNYMAQLSVDYMSQGTRANAVLGKITLIATILVPMNVICGIFGMNVPVPGGVVPGDLYWFYGIVGFFVLIVLISVTVARRMHYV